MSEVIYGKNSLLEALRSNPSGDTFNEVLLLKDDKDVTSLCLKNKVKYTILGKDKFNNILRDKKIDNVNHQGCLGIIKEYEYYNLNDLLTDDGDLIIALDGLEDPHNLGAIIRTCEISGASGIILPKNRSVRVTPTVEKVSTGATRYVKVAQVTNLVSSLKELKRHGYWIVGAEASEKSVNYWSPDYKRKICLYT